MVSLNYIRSNCIPYLLNILQLSILPVLYAKPEHDKYIDTILLHGGYDSYMEECLSMILYLRENGFAVYLFEGPGQGSILRKNGLPFSSELQKPEKAILDFYNLNDVTIIGLSLGAALAPRVAAFEKRIKRVVAWSLLPHLLDVLILNLPEDFQDTIRTVISNEDKNKINYIVSTQMKSDPKY